jgi:hypothetical protein
VPRIRVLATVVGVCVYLPVCGCLPANTWASQTVKLKVGFSPDRLGASTTIMVGFDIGTPNGQVPSPLTDFDLSLPLGVGLGSTTLGEVICNPKALEAGGPTSCSPNSLMGSGSALVEVPIGPEIVQEPVNISIFMGPPQDNHTSMLIYADGRSPISAQLVFPGVLLPHLGPFGAHLDTAIPLTPSVPGAPDAAVVHMESSLGPSHLIYYRRVRDKTVDYRPIGMAVPKSCPRGGFPFAATFTFQDGTFARALAAVPCPASRVTSYSRATS